MGSKEEEEEERDGKYIIICFRKGYHISKKNNINELFEKCLTNEEDIRHSPTGVNNGRLNPPRKN